jgi:general secretion pathway protein J
MNRRAHLNPQAAFTLIEVLIAVSIFAIVLGAINTVFYSALKLRNKTSELLDKSVPVEQAITIIERDLRNLVPPNGPLSGQLQSAPPLTNAIPGAVGPVFYCASANIDDVNPWPEVQKVSYVITPSTNRLAGNDLFRVVDRNLLAPIPEQPDSQWLMSGVQQIAFQYYDGTAWQDSWDSTLQEPKLPKAIKLQIQFVPEDSDPVNPVATPLEIVVPVMVEARTNQTTNATSEVDQP